MSFGFDLKPKNELSVAMSNNVSSLNALDEPDTFEGVGSGIGTGIMKGGANVARLAGMAGSVFPIAYDALAGGTEAQDAYFENVIDETLNPAVDYWTPDASKVGTAGQVMNGLLSIGIPLAVTRGNPSLLVADQSANTATDLVRQGVDSNTASGAGAIQGLATAAGFKLPFLGKNLMQSISLGVGGNLALNTAATAAQQQTLEAGGYDDIAEQYDPFDAEARLVDVLTGAVFGGIAHMAVVGRPRQIKESDITPSDKAAILTANNAKHFQYETAPGRPSDPMSSVIHQDAMETALNQIARGEPVDVAGINNIDRAGFVPREKNSMTADDIGMIREEETATNDPIFDSIADQQSPAPVRDIPENPTVKTQAAESDTPVMLQNPEYAEALRTTESMKDMMVNIEEGDTVRSVRISELMKEIEDQAKVIEADGKAFDAAMNCYLNG